MDSNLKKILKHIEVGFIVVSPELSKPVTITELISDSSDYIEIGTDGGYYIIVDNDEITISSKYSSNLFSIKELYFYSPVTINTIRNNKIEFLNS